MKTLSERSNGWFLVHIIKPMSTEFRQDNIAWCKYINDRKDFTLKKINGVYEQPFGFAYESCFNFLCDMNNDNNSINYEPLEPLILAVDKNIHLLGRMQIDLLLLNKLTTEEFNVISEKITELKEYMINMPSYKNNIKNHE